ncbi:MAG: hypothetical protein J7K00_04795 [Candidatus Diapherotrites archaeon]|nr:hypothetical protein [Candidatus Diapherotrites archaeon]
MSNIESIIKTMIKSGSSPESVRNTLLEMGVSKEAIENSFKNENTAAAQSPQATDQASQPAPDQQPSSSIDLSNFEPAKETIAQTSDNAAQTSESAAQPKDNIAGSSQPQPVQPPSLQKKQEMFPATSEPQPTNNEPQSPVGLSEATKPVETAGGSADTQKSLDITDMDKKLAELKQQVESIPVDNITSSMELLSQERSEGLSEHSKIISELSEKVSQVQDKIDSSSPDNIKELTLAVDDLRKMLNEMKPMVFALHEIDKKILDTNREVLFELAEKIHAQKQENPVKSNTASTPKPSVAEKEKTKKSVKKN